MTSVVKIKQTALTPEETARLGALTPTEQRELLDFLRARDEQDKRPPKLEPEPEPEKPKVETKDIEVFVPWDFRVNLWLLRQLGLGTQDGRHTSAGQALWLPRKLLVWAILAWPRFRRMLWVVRSGKAADDVTKARWKACDECPQLKISIEGEAYCGACGCPDWHFSRLRIKNRLAANHCPTKQHPGDYVRLVAHLWPNRKKPDAAKKPASGGCGGNRHG